MTSRWQRVKAAVDVRDCIALIGLCMLGGGLYLIWPPAALAVPGGILVWVSLRGHSKPD